MENSVIEWTADTFNPWVGCDPVAPECLHCYAEALNLQKGHYDEAKGRRVGQWVDEWKAGVPRYRTSADNWGQPLKWNKQANDLARWPAQRRVFGGSMMDWLDEEAPIEWFVDYMRLISKTPNLDWLLLTKRIENFYDRVGQSLDWLRENLPEDSLHDWLSKWMLLGRPPQNVHLGLTVGSRNMLDHLDFFKRVPARVRFLSIEPLLENIVPFGRSFKAPTRYDIAATGTGQDDCVFDFDSIDGVIVGGESGPSARPIRPMHPWWVDRIHMALELYNYRTRAARPPVKFFFKQWGDWVAYSETKRLSQRADPDDVHIWLDMNGRTYEYDGDINMPDAPGAMHMVRIGKRKSGRLYKGRLYNELAEGVTKDALCPIVETEHDRPEYEREPEYAHQ